MVHGKFPNILVKVLEYVKSCIETIMYCIRTYLMLNKVSIKWAPIWCRLTLLVFDMEITKTQKVLFMKEGIKYR